jgi:hypothetical protein
MNLTKFLDGENPKNTDLILTYVTGILMAILVLVTAKFQNLNWSILQSTVAFIVTADLAGGVISNLTKSTNSFYQKSDKLSIIFLAVHFIQPLLLTIFFGLSFQTFWFLYLFMLFSSIIVRFFSRNEYQRQISGGIVTIGFTIFSLFFGLPSIFIWFPFVYFFKLIFAFSVNHFKKNLN